MLFKSLLATAGLLALTNAQTFPFPDMSGEIFCDGAVRPDYAACDELFPETFGTSIAGPGFNEGTTWTNDGCQIRYVLCNGLEGTFESENAIPYESIKDQCGEYPAGGVRREGQGCVVVETQDNPLTRRDLEVEVAKQDMKERVHNFERRVDVSDLEGRQDCPTVDCYEYTEQVFLDNIRGIQQRVCDNILPDMARCDQERSVTITESVSVGFEVGNEIAGIISASGSFNSERSEGRTETLRTAITIDCDGGSGYVVWYPLMEVSRGECLRGTSTACDGVACINDIERAPCEMQIPMVSQDGRLSGEYDVQCI